MTTPRDARGSQSAVFPPSEPSSVALQISTRLQTGSLKQSGSWQSTSVSPSVGQDLLNNGLLAILYAIIGILIALLLPAVQAARDVARGPVARVVASGGAGNVAHMAEAPTAGPAAAALAAIKADEEKKLAAAKKTEK